MEQIFRKVTKLAEHEKKKMKMKDTENKSDMCVLMH